MQSWITEHVASIDTFVDVAQATAAHRATHGCDAFENGSGPLLGILAKALRARRVLEIGTALGYGALWLAHGAEAGSAVDTIERDEVHAELAREQFRQRKVDNIVVHVGDDVEILARLVPHYDLIFYDAYVPTPAHLAHFDRLLADHGALVTSNLFLGRYAPDLPGLAEGARYRDALFASPWFTAFITSGKALTVRL